MLPACPRTAVLKEGNKPILVILPVNMRKKPHLSQCSGPLCTSLMKHAGPYMARQQGFVSCFAKWPQKATILNHHFSKSCCCRKASLVKAHKGTYSERRLHLKPNETSTSIPHIYGGIVVYQLWLIMSGASSHINESFRLIHVI